MSRQWEVGKRFVSVPAFGRTSNFSDTADRTIFACVCRNYTCEKNNSQTRLSKCWTLNRGTKKSLNNGGGFRSAGQLKSAAYCPSSVRAKCECSLQVKYCLKLGSYTWDKNDTSVISVQKQTVRKRRRKLAVLFLPPLEIPPSAACRWNNRLQAATCSDGGLVSK